MRLKTWITSTLYSISQAFLGLLLHPYQTMQQLVEEKVFIWMSFIPTVFGGLSIFLWWLGIKFLFIGIPYIGLWIFALLWISFFFAFWQLLLLYLLIRFLISLR